MNLKKVNFLPFAGTQTTSLQFSISIGELPYLVFNTSSSQTIPMQASNFDYFWMTCLVFLANMHKIWCNFSTFCTKDLVLLHATMHQLIDFEVN